VASMNQETIAHKAAVATRYCKAKHYIWSGSKPTRRLWVIFEKKISEELILLINLIYFFDHSFLQYFFSLFCRTSDYSNFKPIVHIAPVSRSESDYLQLVAVTHAG
jgi:hypothetical protein